MNPTFTTIDIEHAYQRELDRISAMYRLHPFVGRLKRHEFARKAAEKLLAGALWRWHDEQFQFASESEPGRWHTVARDTCDCWAGSRERFCWHLSGYEMVTGLTPVVEPLPFTPEPSQPSPLLQAVYAELARPEFTSRGRARKPLAQQIADEASELFAEVRS